MDATRDAIRRNVGTPSPLREAWIAYREAESEKEWAKNEEEEARAEEECEKAWKRFESLLTQKRT